MPQSVADNQKLWEHFLKFIEDNLDEETFHTWFTPSSLSSFDGEKVRIMVPSQFFYKYWDEHFATLIRSGIKKVFGENVKLGYTLQPEKKASSSISQQTKQVEEPEFESHLYPDYTFDNFILGDSNRMPRTIGINIAEKFQDAFNPMFIFGPSGVGKTHLANAIGAYVKKLHPGKRVLYVSAHLLQVQYTESVRNNKFNDFMNFYQTIDTLIIDDIQEISGKKGTQEAFFNIFNHLQHNHRQLIITCDRPPIELDGIEERLISRFNWGIIAELERPNAKLRKDILMSRIRRDKLPFTENIVNYIISNVRGNVRELEGVVNSIMAYSVVYNSNITLDLVTKTIARTVKINQEPPTTEKILSTVCRFYKVTQKDINSPSRKKDIAQARQVSMYLTQKHTKLSTAQIGIQIGKRDHSTVLHACSQTEKRISVDKLFRSEVENIEREILK